jgi:hypothetical protein
VPASASYAGQHSIVSDRRSTGLRTPVLTLVGGIDDATSRVTGAPFREPESRRGRAQTRHLSTLLTRFFDSDHPARARDLSTQVRHQCRKVRLAAPPSAWGCRPPPRGGSREPASQPTESGSPRLHTQPAHQGRRGRRSVGRPRRASHRTTFRDARGGSASPVARRGPGGRGVGRASEPPARRQRRPLART